MNNIGNGVFQRPGSSKEDSLMARFARIMHSSSEDESFENPVQSTHKENWERLARKFFDGDIATRVIFEKRNGSTIEEFNSPRGSTYVAKTVPKCSQEAENLHTLEKVSHVIHLVASKRISAIYVEDTIIIEAGTQSLAQVLRKKISLDRINQIMGQLCHFVLDLSEKGYVHCDLKPKNIVFKDSLKNDQIAVIDFEGLKQKKSNSRIMRTYNYAPPEPIYRMKDSHSSAFDVWSLGCIYFEMITGEPLFKMYEDVLVQLCQYQTQIGELSPDFMEIIFQEFPYLKTCQNEQGRLKSSKVLIDEINTEINRLEQILKRGESQNCSIVHVKERLDYLLRMRKNLIKLTYQFNWRDRLINAFQCDEEAEIYLARIEKMLCLQPKNRIPIEDLYHIVMQDKVHLNITISDEILVDRRRLYLEIMDSNKKVSTYALKGAFPKTCLHIDELEGTSTITLWDAEAGEIISSPIEINLMKNQTIFFEKKLSS